METKGNFRSTSCVGEKTEALVSVGIGLFKRNSQTRLSKAQL